MVDATKLARAIFFLKGETDKINVEFDLLKSKVDNDLFKVQKDSDAITDKLMEHLVLSDEQEFFDLLSASEEMQDAWLLKLRKGLGLDEEITGGESELAKESKPRGLPSASELFKTLEKQRFGPKQAEPSGANAEAEFMAECKAKLVAGGSKPADAEDQCRKQWTQQTQQSSKEERERLLADSKVKSAEQMFKELQKKKDSGS